MKIVIRADGGNKIGMGHIMRTLVLAKELAKTNDVFYICRTNNPLTDKYSPGIEKIRSEGFNVITINEHNIIEELKKISADCLITDSYDIDENYFNETKKIFNKTGYIDDMNLHYFNVDFLINQNINAKDLVYRVNEDTKLFLGTDYIMLREEFRNIPKKVIKENVEDIMITLGGSDPSNVTELILGYVKDFNYKYHVVVGPSFKDINKLKEIGKENENINLYFHANMYELMKKCDIAISACGSTLYELAACSVPTIGLIIAGNQEEIAYKMNEKKLIYNLGWYRDLTKDKIIYNIKKISKLGNREIIINKQKIVNKDGVEILVKEIERIQKN